MPASERYDAESIEERGAAARAKLATEAGRAWRQHFSRPAAEILSLAACFAGFDLQEALLRCFKRSKAGRITEPTVCAVLQELSEEAERRDEALQAELLSRLPAK